MISDEFDAFPSCTIPPNLDVVTSGDMHNIFHLPRKTYWKNIKQVFPFVAQADSFLPKPNHWVADSAAHRFRFRLTDAMCWSLSEIKLITSLLGRQRSILLTLSSGLEFIRGLYASVSFYANCVLKIIIILSVVQTGLAHQTFPMSQLISAKYNGNNLPTSLKKERINHYSYMCCTFCASLCFSPVKSHVYAPFPLTVKFYAVW